MGKLFPNSLKWQQASPNTRRLCLFSPSISQFHSKIYYMNKNTVFHHISWSLMSDVSIRDLSQVNKAMQSLFADTGDAKRGCSEALVLYCNRVSPLEWDGSWNIIPAGCSTVNSKFILEKKEHLDPTAAAMQKASERCRVNNCWGANVR